jgi:sec-independent protein translocase protein TatB
MEILGIGPSELLFIVIIALIVLGPRDMQKAGRTIGKWLRKVVTSDGWKLFQQTSREIQTLPNRLMREAALDELREVQNDLRQPLDINREASQPTIVGTPSSAPTGQAQPETPQEPENKIMPPGTPPSTPDSPAPDKDPHA